MGKVIRVVGASEHNLRNVSLDIPRDELVVLTGVSGSGKSSLAFDTVFREGQRRFVESLSSYARQFIGQMQKPAVERIEGLSPAICIDQKTVNRNPRSTVGTTTEILDHLRLLFARLGTASCPTCGEPIEARTPGQIAERLLLDAEGHFALIMAPVVRARKGEYRREQQEWREAGYQRARIDGELHDLAETKVLARYEIHTLELVLDRLKLEEKNLPRLREAIDKALGMAERTVSVLFGEEALEGRGTHRMFSATRACPRGHIELPEIEPRSFSFNNPHGACPRCKGLGQLRTFDDALLVPDGRLALVDGALKAMTAKGNLMFAEWGARELRAISQRHGFSLATPWEELPDEAREAVLREGVPEKGVEGAIPILERLYDQWHISLLERFMRSSACPACHGTRLGPVAQAVKFRDRTISDFTQLTIGELRRFFDGVELSVLETRVGREIFREIRERLLFLDAVGLGYLALDRSAVTLSGGEAQRIRLAAQVGAGLQGVLYVLDEPSIGLHPRDNKRLLATLRRLRDQGNSVLVVEHDEETMQSADSIVDIGPGAGSLGGEIVGQGRWDELAADPRSPTGEYLSGKRSVPMPAVRRPCAGTPRLVVRGARENNLKDVDVAIPLGRFVALTGVSGSGKSTLMDAILAPALENTLHGASRRVGHHHAIDGIEHLDKAVEIDQTPIGRTPRSNPATYTKVFDEIRNLFASLPESKARGYKPGQFSFNVAGGRCEECQGSGVREIEMQLLANVQVVCEECGGKRFGAPTLEVHFKGKTISDVLDMTIDQALEFFSALPKIRRGLETLQRIGLGYVHLGQPSTTLSGGEAQRMKLASELQRPATGRTIYLLDEPTTGLHFQDVERLVDALQELVDRGNTVLVIEHNLDLVRAADWVVDLGPEGGELGGYLLAQGAPEEVAADAGSATGRYLARAIEEGRTAAERAARHAARGAEKASQGKRKGKASKAKAAKGSFGRDPADAAETTAAIAAGERIAAERRGELAALETAEGIALAEEQRDLDIRVRGACKHNLKNVSVRIPRHKLTVVTGPSGSGKTSLAFDTLFAEGQRRFVESLSTYARRFLGRLEKGDAESIEGLAPAIAIDQQTASRSPRSTVATATEIYDYLRLLWSRAGTAHDPGDGAEIRGWTAAQAADAAIEAAEGKILSILAPIFLPKVDFPLFLQSPEQLPRVADQLVELGFETALIGEETVDLRDCPAIRRNAAVSLRIDRVRAGSNVRRRVLEAALKARERGQGLMEFRWDGGGRMLLSTLPGNARTGYFQKEPWEPKHFSFNSHFGACPTCEGLGWTRGAPCAVCKGDRLRPETAAVRVGGIRLPEFTRLTVDEALAFVRKLKLPRTAQTIAAPVLREILGRLQFLSDVGVGYLGLDRAGSTLSGGEAQRIRLASQIGSGLEGVLYVLDEPTVGLHQNDTARLVETLYRLRDLGNTVLVVEHDPELIRAADHVVDMGPGAGEEGGEVVASGTLGQILTHPTSRTAQYLGGRSRIGRPQTLPSSEAWIRMRGARMHNLKEIDCDIPMGRLSAIAGVSGSGKSTLALDLLVPALQAKLEGKRIFRNHLRESTIERDVAEVVLVDQTPIGTTPRSNPASFTGVWDAIRDLFATLPESKVRGFDKGRFSFNMGGGRCPACEGRGYILLEMHFVSDVWVVCEACRGKRFQEDTLAVKFRGKDVSDVLAMRVDEAAKFFAAHRRVKTMLETLERIGLGYLRLGQPATELSGGEAQRLKIASELGRARRGRAVYVLDEPTTGLHLSDIDRLVQALRLLVDRGDTVVVVEHQLDVIRAADWMLELGPGGGEAGGKVLFQGLPEACPRSTPTGRALRDYAAHFPPV